MVEEAVLKGVPGSTDLRHDLSMIAAVGEDLEVDFAAAREVLGDLTRDPADSRGAIDVSKMDVDEKVQGS